MIKKDQKPHIILASRSPRRRDLLRQTGLLFDIMPAEVDETPIPGLSHTEFPLYLAREKAAVVSKKFPESWIIGADTIVAVGNDILGKPDSPADAERMLRRLSGNVHRVITGFAVACAGKNHVYTESVITDVRFKELTSGEIDWYIQTGESLDKAGAYAIQGIGAFMVKRIRGSYTNVVGLPVCEVTAHLMEIGIMGDHMEHRVSPKPV